jgi:two-component system, OmpR family, sensor histidine kinase MprB
MSLRARIASIVAMTVAVILVLVGAGLQAITSATLIGAVDMDLRAIAQNIERDPQGTLLHAGPARGRLGGAAGVAQLVGEQGAVRPPLGVPPSAGPGRGGMRGLAQTADLPVDDGDLAVARGEVAASLRTVEVDDVRLRVLTAPLGEQFAVQVARPLDEVDAVIAALRVRTALLTLAGALLAAAIAWLIAGRSIRPVRDLTEAVERVRDGRDLARRADVRAGIDGDDEVARLAAAFDAMLLRLDASRVAQDQLAADASHELRTPLTSLRTNVEVLARDAERLAPGDRLRLTEDVIGQLEELTAMVDGLATLTRVDTGAAVRVLVDLRDLLRGVVDASRRRHPQRAQDLTLDIGDECAAVIGDERELTLAVSAMIENAVKYTRDGPITVALGPRVEGLDRAQRGGDRVRISVSDVGPGVGPEHLPQLFARFYRAPEARSKPGAGLGLALVERVARAHGGTVTASNVDPHGLEIALELPLEQQARCAHEVHQVRPASGP